ncbi:glycosyltransferase family 39 protein [Pinisolibacter aquiterrae]|uniref:glycosyltransferase family 39 protein n=1 Tax=Pinisolibacter aquiterrae TaxID=2815579 RepID=UPI001C3DE9D7|nr:glycosyltransferase family 39 protein [Pinisolibacter aquiterrae]MBV5266707.1 glycosyltransferase family 39 protein [Pinisolibacter aquiterrae]MCC8234980.1 glycosyltransferase family 39 protein [Pinisolibacter aquiterrae]
MTDRPAFVPTRPASGSPPGGLVALIVGLTVLRLSVAAATGLVDDETYYRLWSLHLAFGYLDHAPMVAWLIAAGRAIAGEGSLGVRLFAPIMTALGSLLLWRTVALFEGRAVATSAVVWLNAMVLIGAGSILMTPDGPSVFFWGASIWALAELTARRDPRWWLVVGAAAGLGLFSKYSVLFLGLGIGLWLLSTRETRRWFGAWQLWVGAVIAAGLFAPVILWNAQHDWVSFLKQFGRTVPHEWRPEKLAELIGVQILLIGVPMVPFVLLGLRRALGRADAAALLPILTGVPFLAYLLFHSLHGGVEGNWPAPLYPSLAWLAAAGATVVEGRADRFAGFARRLRGWVAPVGFALTGLVYLHVLVPLVVLPANRDPTAQMKGWPAFGRDLEALAAKVGATRFGGPNYTLASQLAAQLGAERVAPFDERERYIGLPVLDPAKVCAPLLFVDRAGRDSLLAVREAYATVTPLGTLARSAGGHVIEDHPVTLLAGRRGCPGT